MIYLIGYLVIGLLFGTEQLYKYFRLVEFKMNTAAIAIIGLVVWMVAWPVFTAIKIYQRELA